MDLELDPILLLPLALVIFMMALPHLRRRMLGTVNFVKTYDLNKQLVGGSDVVVIDLRKEKDFANRHIRGAVNIPMSDLEERLYTEGQGLRSFKDQKLVIVCKSDFDSIRAARKLERYGFTDITVMKGGMFRWGLDRLPMERGE